MRKNHIKHNDGHADLSKFDRVYIELPEVANTSRIFAIPLKTIFYNTNTHGLHNLDRVYYDIAELEEFFDACGVNLG